jgi:hypothetical protein
MRESRRCGAVILMEAALPPVHLYRAARRAALRPGRGEGGGLVFPNKKLVILH